MTDNEKVNDRKIREASNNIDINGRLVGFLYDLMRDHVTPGTIQKLLETQLEFDANNAYSNGWLASYALYVANQLNPTIEYEGIDE